MYATGEGSCRIESVWTELRSLALFGCLRNSIVNTFGNSTLEGRKNHGVGLRLKNDNKTCPGWQ